MFIEDCKEEESVKKSSFKVYNGVFNKLKLFFEDKPIATITINDFKAFRRYLKTIITNRKAPLSNYTINEIMLYTNMFIEYAITNKHIKENNIKAIRNLKETSKTKANFFDKQVLDIINSKEFDDKYIFCFKMMPYHGMRFNDLFNLQESWKKEKDGVKYLDFEHGKTINTKRIVPIHPKMVDDFPLFPDKSYNAGYKEAKKQIEKLYPPNSGFGLHTFRGTFVEKALNENPERLSFIQKVVGHALTSQNKLTIEKYAKNVKEKIYKKIVDSVDYNSN